MSDVLRINTASLDAITTRIREVRKRINNLHPRIQRLYWTGEVSGIYRLYYYNRFHNGYTKLSKCRDYLNQTIAELGQVETYYANIDPLHFQAPSGGIVALENARDSGIISRRDIMLPTNVPGRMPKYLYAIAGFSEESLHDLIEANPIGPNSSVSDLLYASMKDKTGARQVAPSQARQPVDYNKLYKVLLESTAGAAKGTSKLEDNEDLGLLSSTFSFGQELVSFTTGKGTALDTYAGAISLSKSGVELYDAAVELSDKSVKGKMLATYPGLTSLNMIASGLGFSKSFIETVKLGKDYHAKEGSGYDYAAGIINTTGAAGEFGAGIYTLWKAPITSKAAIGSVTKGTLTANAAFLRNCSIYTSIFSAGIKTVSKTVESYGEYNADGKVTGSEWSSAIVRGGLHGLNTLFLGLIPSEIVDGAAKKLDGFVDNWAAASREIIDQNPELAALEDKNWATAIYVRATGCGIVANRAVSSFFKDCGSTIKGWFK